jgi:hypothetical protein
MTIEEIADDCITFIPKELKETLLKTYSNPEDFANALHFFEGLAIRNKYIHGKDIQSGMHPDDLSNEILKQIYKKLQ